MNNWNSYKETYRSESTVFDFARTGDFRGFANLILEGEEFDINAVDHRGYCALMLAVYNGEKDFCEALLRYGANVNSVDSMGNTVLMGAAFKGNVPIFQLLLSFGADLQRVNKAQMTARDWGIMFARKELVSYLDLHHPSEQSGSKIKNIGRFIKLAFMMLGEKIKPSRDNHRIAASQE